DSFTYNLANELGRHGIALRVMRNDAPALEELLARPPVALVLSPGPGTPQRAGRSIELIRALRGKSAMLGVCLGHQAIAVAYGGRVQRGAVVHGRATAVEHAAHPLFAGIPTRFTAGRYHSLHVDGRRLPRRLVPLAVGDDGTLMAVADRRLPVYGLQFHPESVLTRYGPRLLSNFLTLAGFAA
ncbi:MAG: aminodeoxychorismate/anthranilate synthase component II, partial [Candidatus Eremiobacteraeota bacterium]|nr:aminodeoxychorismate/anthranilate synthase component II [Candidatus Eremiobacteraeota bacterium]